jgi:hypothetical protein
MDETTRQSCFELLIELRKDVRHRICFPGTATAWHLARGRRIIAESVVERCALVGESVANEDYQDYVLRLPHVLERIEEQDSACQKTWGKYRDDRDRSFQLERDELIDLFEEIHIYDLAYERAARQAEKPLLPRSRRLQNDSNADQGERDELENAIRMTLRSFVENEKAIQSALRTLDETRLLVGQDFEPWAVSFAESRYPGSRPAREGALKALHRAVCYYNHRRGYSFEEYAKHWLEEHMLRALLGPQ